MKADAKRCAKTVHRGHNAWYGYPCKFPAIIERNGKWWCKRHDPDNVAKKNAERSDKWKAQWEAEKAAIEDKNKRLDAYPRLVAELKRLCVEIPKQFGDGKPFDNALLRELGELE